jgi:hypothetical protein
MKTFTLLSGTIAAIFLVGCGHPNEERSVTPQTHTNTNAEKAATFADMIGPIFFDHTDPSAVLLIYAEMAKVELQLGQDNRNQRPRVSIPRTSLISRPAALKLMETALREQAGVLLSRIDERRVAVSFDDSVIKKVGN